jgi:hypothetical protein
VIDVVDAIDRIPERCIIEDIALDVFHGEILQPDQVARLANKTSDMVTF